MIQVIITLQGTAVQLFVQDGIALRTISCDPVDSGNSYFGELWYAGKLRFPHLECAPAHVYKETPLTEFDRLMHGQFCSTLDFVKVIEDLSNSICLL